MELVSHVVTHHIINKPVRPVPVSNSGMFGTRRCWMGNSNTLRLRSACWVDHASSGSSFTVDIWSARSPTTTILLRRCSAWHSRVTLLDPCMASFTDIDRVNQHAAGE